jgi:hypothetical protein
MGNTPDGKLRTTVRGRRMSGDMNTSAGNCLIMCAMVWEYCRARGVRADLVNNGDDCVVFCEAADFRRFNHGLNEWFLELGFEMEVEDPVYELEKVVFCQAQPVHVGENNYVMVRQPNLCLAKDANALISCDHPLSLKSWCGEVGLAGTAAYGGIPVLDSFYKYYSRQGTPNPKWSKSYQTRGFDYLAKGMTRRGYPVLDVTRLSFYVAFGILPEEQLCIERYYDELPNLPSGLPRPSLETSPGLPPEYALLF